MNLTEVIDRIKNQTLPNVTNQKQMRDDKIVPLINEGLTSLHSMFLLNIEQAIILVPAFRHNFKIENKDPNVIMATHYKLAECEILLGGLRTKADQIAALLDFDRRLNRNVLLENETSDTSIFRIKGDQCLKILEVSDEKNTKYVINEDNVFATSQTTLYFPNCKEGDIIYVAYKPKPIKVIGEFDEHGYLTNGSEEVDLPETFIECLNAFVSLKVVSGIEGMKEFYPNLINNYNQELQKAREHQFALVENLQDTIRYQKGFL
jgi:hypothetical protein|uniref:Head to tail adaptor n=1 Tax=Podoviridae sp. ctiuS14 TaxID=2827620 RepID=A0A8S5LMJ4_9CAUD|nr:MAG TPA: head to tail adaptor [Podoviridae sp. ctiuS14]